MLDLDAEHIPPASDRASWRSVEILNSLNSQRALAPGSVASALS
ncbi:hypothetical protein SynMITS9220_01636 [Synechococcus sp. MIT S9220]|nr:hypothetical protein SynMITS9220_01636 [Synechococcus sp. MIT S9220]